MEDERRIMESAEEIEKLTTTVQELRISASQLEAAVEEADQRHSEVEAELVSMNLQVSHLSKTCTILRENQELTPNHTITQQTANTVIFQSQ